MEKTNYQGWTNYETWNLKLWMDNDQGTSEYWNERTEEAYKHARLSSNFTKEEQAALDLMEQIKDEYAEIAENFLESGKCQASWIADFLHAAVSEVNWHEIAESLIEDCDKEE